MSDKVNKSPEHGEGASDTKIQKQAEDHSGLVTTGVSSETKPIDIIMGQLNESVEDIQTAKEVSIHEETKPSSSSIARETVVHKCPLTIQGQPIDTKNLEVPDVTNSSKNTNVSLISISSQLKSYVKSTTDEMKKALKLLDKNEESAVEILRQTSEIVERLHKKVNLARKEFMLHADEKIEGLLDITNNLEMVLDLKKVEDTKRTDSKIAVVKPAPSARDTDVSHAFDEIKAALSEIESSLDQLDTSFNSPKSSDDTGDTTQFNISLDKTK